MRLQDFFGIQLPVIQAPMAGSQGSALAIAVCNAGGLGSLPCALLTPDAMRVWIDVGAPEAARLHRAAKLAPRVAVYSHKDAEQLAVRLRAEKIHRAEALELYAVDREWLAALCARLARRMEFALTVADGHVYLSFGSETLTCTVRRVPLAER